MRDGKLNFLYEIKEGKANSSYGIEVAAFMGYLEEDCKYAYQQKEEMDAPFDEGMKAAYSSTHMALEGDEVALEAIFRYV